MPYTPPDSLAHNVYVSADKQRRILDMIDSWKIYKVDPFKGNVLRYYPYTADKTAFWRHMQPRVSPITGRPRFHLHYRHQDKDEKGTYETIFAQHLMWLVAYGPFDPHLRLKPIDGNWMNFQLENITVDLQLRKEMVEGNSMREFDKKVRYEEIRMIRGMMAANADLTPGEVSKALELNYQSVMRAMTKIRKGEKLRFEDPGPYNQAKNGFSTLLPTDFL